MARRAILTELEKAIVAREKTEVDRERGKRKGVERDRRIEKKAGEITGEPGVTFGVI